MESIANLLPAEFLEPGVHELLSFDANAYFRCDACWWEWRFNPSVNVLKPADFAGAACPDGDGGRLSLVRHVLTLRTRCDDCGRPTITGQAGTMRPVTCEYCGSGRFTVVESALDLPRRFKNLSLLGATRDHIWGLAVAADLDAVHAEQDGLMQWQRDGPAYLIPAVRFVNRLRIANEYPKDADWQLVNFEAVILNEFYRHTSHFEAGLRAITMTMEMLNGDVPDAARPALEHNLAMDAYSLAARAQPELEALGGLDRVREIGLEAAQTALERYLARDRDEHVRIHIARVRHTWGDLLKVGSATLDDAVAAVRQLNLAIAEPALPEHMRTGARNSRATALLVLGRLRGGADDAAFDQAEADLLSSIENTRRMRDPFTTLLQLGAISETRGRKPQAISYVKAATGIALDELRAARTESSAILVADQFCVAFDRLARLRAEAGHFRSALETLETARAANLRYAREPAEGNRDRVGQAGADFFARQLSGERPDWMGGPALDADDGAEAAAPTPLVDRALDLLAAAGWPADTAICVMTGDNATLTTIVVHRAGGDWTIDALQSPLDVAPLAAVIEGHNVRSGPRRAKKLRRACAHLGNLITPDLIALLRNRAIKRLAISAPGQLGHFPYEATPVDGVILLDRLEMCYLPSMAIGAELARTAPAGGGRVLFVRSGATDLKVADEVAAVRRAFRGRVDVLDGRVATKADVLTALAGPYSIVHLACHGWFDKLEPERSFLYLDSHDENDSKRIAARELEAVRFSHAPIVMLSACQSGLTSYGPMNECAGLTGALLRAGARGVVASRWEVDDGLAGSFMSRLYALLGEGLDVQRAVTQVQRELHKTSEIENWAAFSYLGVPRMKG